MRIRTRLLIWLAVLGLSAAACGGGAEEPGETTSAPAAAGQTSEAAAPAAGGEPVSVGLVYDIGGRGDQSFNDAAAAGLDRAKSELGVSASEASANEDGTNREELLALQASEGADVVIGVGFLFSEPMSVVAAEFPEVDFAIVDSLVEAPNVAGLLFSEEQGSFLVGVAAALKSESGKVGFIGGVNIPLIHAFEAGFLAGVGAVDSSVEVVSQYVTEPPDFGGFNDPAAGRVIAQSMFEEGADVVYHAAGGTGGGLFQAAKDFSEANGTHVWAIGVDSDQYLTAGEEFGPYILTSMLKRVDVAVFNTVAAVQGGSFSAGEQRFDLAVDGVGYSTTGGHVDDIVPQLEEWKARIVSGEIVVSRDPSNLAAAVSVAGGEPVSVGLVYDIGGRGDQSFNDAAAAGLDRAKSELGVSASEASANEDGTNREELLALQASEGADVVIGVGFLFSEPMSVVAAEFPEVDFAIVDSLVEAPNVAGLLFSEEQGSFLVGVAAALKSESGKVGFIGGVNIPLIHAFEAGFLAGVGAVDSSVEVVSQYVTEPPDFGGFNDPAAGRVIAQSMFEEGADVVYHAAGGTGGGLFQAAKDFSEANGTHVWAIGVDSDQYLTAGEEFGPYILTSMLKRVDVAVFNTVAAVQGGSFSAGEQRFDLAVDGVGYSTTGGHVDDIVPQLEEWKARIVSGELEVSRDPADYGG